MDSTIIGRIAEYVFVSLIETVRTAQAIFERLVVRQVIDTGAIQKAIDDLMAANADKAAVDHKNRKVVGGCGGQTMRATGGKANPAWVNEILRKKLGV